MTIRELIEQLDTFPPDAIARGSDYEEGCYEITAIYEDSQLYPGSVILS